LELKTAGAIRPFSHPAEASVRVGGIVVIGSRQSLFIVARLI